MRAAFGKFIKAFIARWGNAGGGGETVTVTETGTRSGSSLNHCVSQIYSSRVYVPFTVDFAGGIRTASILRFSALLLLHSEHV